ncbi:hypothetical protein LCGC14_2496610, partial [marine sediment metagenome]
EIRGQYTVYKPRPPPITGVPRLFRVVLTRDDLWRYWQQARLQAAVAPI